ncbi:MULTISPECIES: fimbrial protein [Serratia]|uniref:Fimbrial protein n=3 Tax=Serratia TaxID=613 RepID=A0ABC9IN96_SERMA|nr:MULTISPECIES: fimbrial protein [Serratia]AVU32139.1 type 1 fimbrial protein [Serratia marcescens]MBE5256399.1 type 1 fimbrial protein [Serratia marcescens]MBE5300667.1 type 1 fimbrial protein [Serratia marcescens]MBE5301801.1 type 1 fimbrial protein [Serratia marcescens]MBN5183154.1 type 1 fimbrial protein [Serratia marcescens]
MMIATVRKRMPLLTLFSAAILSPSLYAADGNINVTGRVVENACVVAAESKNIMVDFGVQAGNSSLGGRGYWETIRLLDCPSGAKQVKIRFEGTAISGNEYIFAPDNQGQPGAAQNVGFTIYNRYPIDTDIKVNGESQPYELENSGSGSVNELDFGVMLRWLNGGGGSQSIPLGEATSTIQFSILYN